RYYGFGTHYIILPIYPPKAGCVVISHVWPLHDYPTVDPVHTTDPFIAYGALF
ncbi:3812_t:CDS:1, partial [Rhizophagus irregularis]